MQAIRVIAAALVAIVICGTGMALAAEEEPASPPVSLEGQLPAIPDGQDVREAIEAAEREEAEREQELQSPELVRQREESRYVFANLSDAEAQDLLLRIFGQQMASLNADPARYLSDVELVRSYGELGATVRDEGDGSLLEADIPLRTENAEGDLAKVDLTLEEAGAGFEPTNPLAALHIPDSAGEAIEIGEEGLGLEAVGADEDSAARLLGEKNVWFSEARTDTDLLIAPTAGGVEIFDQLRSAQSPEVLRYRLDLPEGALLHRNGAGAVDISKDGEVFAFVSPPSAIDAQGSNVPVEMEVEGSTLVVEVPHHEGDFAYPILVDPTITENWGTAWYYGTNLSAITTPGVWKYDTNDPTETYILHDTHCLATALCSPSGRGLFISTLNRNIPENTWAQWYYSVPGATTFIPSIYPPYSAHLNPFWRSNEGCNWNDYKQPHDYNGSFDANGKWLWFETDRAQWIGTATMVTNAKGIAFGMSSGGGVNIPCWRDIMVGGTVINLDDPEQPTLSSVTGVPTTWVSDATQFTITANVSDPGLGVQNVTMTPKGSVVRYFIAPQSQCPGTKTNPCPASRAAQMTVNADLYDEGEKGVDFSAYDPTAKVSNTISRTTRVDRTPPEVTLAGQLAVETDEAEGDSKDPEKWDALPLPAYNLKIEATDVAPGGLTSDPATKRSGVKSIEVFLDAETTPEKTWSQTCPASSCPMTQTYQLNLSALGAGTHHTLKVVAKDQVGKKRERNIEFEYFPATGIKDSYVMHHFPLDDGQGNEEDELHPARPELAVNVVNGNLVYRERDIDVEGAAADLEVERYYNSQLPEAENTEWGDGWTLAQTPDLEPIDTGGTPAPDEADLLEASGAIEEGVVLPTEAGAQQFDPALQATLEKKASGGYELVDETGESATTVAFDEGGQTEALLTEGQAKVDYSYEGGELAEITVEDPGSAGSPTEPTEDEEPSEPGPYTGVLYAEAFGEEGSAPGQLKLPADVAVDASGDLWVIDRENARIQKFSPEGEYLDSFGSEGTANGQFIWPSGIAIDPEGNIFVTDSANHRVQKFNSKGEYLSKFGSYGTANGQFNGPAGIAISPNGAAIFITDRGNHRIQRFTKEGAYFGKVGSYGWEDAQFDEPLALAIGAPQGESTYTVFVIDGGNDRVQRFTPLGVFLGKFGTYGQGDGQLDSPANIEIDAKGNVWVGDRKNARVQLFDQAGTYIDQFGAKGSEEGQFDLAYPMGIATDGAGGIWVTDGNHHRLQKWVAGSYVPSEEELPEDDPVVEVETPEGLVSSVEGEEAGQHSYSHTGDLLTAHEGPDGETKYAYDSSGRMTKVTLANETWASIEYHTSGRVGAVTVALKSTEPKTTYFGYATEPHQTAVVPPDAPAVTYDIGEDGSVFKWWNTEEPPQFDDISGSLYFEREKGPIPIGDHNLILQAHSEHGIASIQFIANGNVLIDEIECDKPQVTECKTLINEWVTETGAHAPGILNLEVIATNGLGDIKSERFWVDIPYTPPPQPGALTPPKFKDVKQFREEYGLEVIFPVANELELNDRIFDLIGAWHNPHTPAGEVARTSWERWGVPLRPADVAELEYRQWYTGGIGSMLEDWGTTERSNTYAGYYVDHSSGGIIKVGFTSDQAASLTTFEQQMSPPAQDRLQLYPVLPSISITNLVQKEEIISASLESSAMLRAIVTEIWIDYAGNSVNVGASDISQATQLLQQALGSLNGINVVFQPNRSSHSSGRNRATGRMLAGDRIVIKESNSACTAGFGAYEKRSQKSNGKTITVPFFLTSGHCYARDIEVWRSPYEGFGGKTDWAKLGQVTRNPYEHGAGTIDAEAVKLEAGGLAPRRIYGRGGNRPKFGDPVVGHRNQRLCFSGAITGGVRCGDVVGIRKVQFEDECCPVGSLKIDAPNIPGDSGGPVWDPSTGAAVGILRGHVGQFTWVQPLLDTPNNKGLVYRGALEAAQMFDLQLMTGD